MQAELVGARVAVASSRIFPRRTVRNKTLQWEFWRVRTVSAGRSQVGHHVMEIHSSVPFRSGHSHDQQLKPKPLVT